MWCGDKCDNEQGFIRRRLQQWYCWDDAQWQYLFTLKWVFNDNTCKYSLFIDRISFVIYMKANISVSLSLFFVAQKSQSSPGEWQGVGRKKSGIRHRTEKKKKRKKTKNVFNAMQSSSLVRVAREARRRSNIAQRTQVFIKAIFRDRIHFTLVVRIRNLKCALSLCVMCISVRTDGVLFVGWIRA